MAKAGLVRYAGMSPVGEHEDRKVPQCPLVAYPPVLTYSGGINIVPDVILRSDMELTGSPYSARHSILKL